MQSEPPSDGSAQPHRGSTTQFNLPPSSPPTQISQPSIITGEAEHEEHSPDAGAYGEFAAEDGPSVFAQGSPIQEPRPTAIALGASQGRKRKGNEVGEMEDLRGGCSPGPRTKPHVRRKLFAKEIKLRKETSNKNGTIGIEEGKFAFKEFEDVSHSHKKV